MAFFSLKKRRLRGDLTAVLSSLMDALEEMEADSSETHALLGRKATGTWDTGKHVFTMRVVKPWGMCMRLLSQRPILRGAQKW